MLFNIISSGCPLELVGDFAFILKLLSTYDCFLGIRCYSSYNGEASLHCL